MGEQNKWRNIHNQEGLKRRYMALLVPALAKVHANHPQGSLQLDRARAIRRAADTCLVQALATTNAYADHHHDRVSTAHRTCVPHVASAASRLKLRKAAAARRASSSFRLQALIIRGKSKPNSNCAFRLKAARGSRNIGKRAIRAALRRADYYRSSKGSRRNHGGNEQGRDVEGSIPAESELRRLQSVLFPQKNKTTDNIAGNDNPENCSSSIANPAALLSQAAHYIFALQVQVEALRSLASLSVDSPSTS